MKQLFPQLMLSGLLVVPIFSMEVTAKKKQVNEWTPLHVAVIKQDLAEIKTLIDDSADCNVKNNHGNTPLHLSLVTLHKLTDQDLAIAQMLIAAGARVHDCVNGGSPLETLLYKTTNIRVPRYRKLIKTLLLAGVDAEGFQWMKNIFNHIFSKSRTINYQDDDLQATSLMYAAAQGRLKKVTLRLRKGANIFLKDEYQRTVFDMVKIILGNKDDLKLSEEKEELYKTILRACYRHAAKNLWFIFRTSSKGAPILPLDILKYIVWLMTGVVHSEFLTWGSFSDTTIKY